MVLSEENDERIIVLEELLADNNHRVETRIEVSGIVQQKRAVEVGTQLHLEFRFSTKYFTVIAGLRN